MGKGTKRKNAGVGVDFRRVKHKVGKKLPKAQNQTDTSFKSRSITLPEQSLNQDKSGAAVTHRNLTLKDLLGQCAHYSDKVRREALSGLAELLAAHPGELARNSTAVMEALAARVTDGDKGVRGAARDVLAAPVLPVLGAAAAGPFVPLLMAHVCSAMTHLADPIRADALGFLDLLTDWRPDLIASAFLAPALCHFGDLLSKGSRGRSLSAGSLAALHRIITALERFLARVVAAAGPAAAAEGSSSRLVSVTLPQAPGLPLRRARCAWAPLAATHSASPLSASLSGGGLSASAGPAAAAASAGAAASGEDGQQPGGGGSGGGSSSEAAARQLLRHLLDCWSDCGPAQLAQAPDLQLAQCLLCTLRSIDHLLRHWGPQLAGSPADKSSLAQALLKKVPPLFPLLRPAVALSAPVAEALVQLNVAMAQLLVRFLPGQLSPSAISAGEEEGGWPARLLDWFEAVMREGAALPGDADESSERFEQQQQQGPAAAEAAPQSQGGGKKGAQRAGKQQQQEQQQQQGGGGGGRGKAAAAAAAAGGGQLPAEVYEAALEGTWGVLPLVGGPRRRALLAAVWALWERSSVRSAARAQVLRFWRRLLADPAASFYTPHPPSGEPLVLPQEVQQWLECLPRFLWELGASSTPSAEAALRALLDGARFACCAPAPLAPLQQQLAPLFATLLPAKPAGKPGRAPAAARVLPGPLAKQPQRIQSLAVDLVLHLPSLPGSTLRTAALLCLTDCYPTDTALRLLEVVSIKAAAASAEADPAAAAAAAAAAVGAGASVDIGGGSSGGGEGSGQNGQSVEGGLGGLLLCLLSGCSKAGVERAQLGQEAAWRRHEAVVAGACRALLGCRCTGPMAEALAEPLLELCCSSGSARPLYGALSAGVALAAATCPELAGSLASGEAAAAGMEAQWQRQQQQQQQQGAWGCAAAEALLLPSSLSAELPGAMLCYAALCCEAAQREPSGAAGPAGASAGGGGSADAANAAAGGASGGAAELAAAQKEGAEEWLPSPREAEALSQQALGASDLPAWLDCITATLAALPWPMADAQGAGSKPASSQPAASPAGAGAVSATAAGSLSRVVSAWLPKAEAAAEGVQGKAAPAERLPTPASWAAAGVQQLEVALGAGGEARQQLLQAEERRAEAALCACEETVRQLEVEGHRAAGGLKAAVQRARTLFCTLFGRDL